MGADPVRTPTPPNAARPVVPVPPNHGAEGVAPLPQLVAPAVVLEPRQLPGPVAKVDLDLDVANQPGTRLADRLQVGETEAWDPLVTQLVAVAEELVAAANGEHHRAAIHRLRERRALRRHHVLG